MDEHAHQDSWREVIGSLDLAPEGWREGALLHRGDVGGVQVNVIVGVFDETVPLRVEVEAFDPRVKGTFSMIPRAAMLARCAHTTGDLAFDDAVAIAYGGPDALYRLGPDARIAVREAIALGAAVGGGRAWLPPAATARLADPADAIEAIRSLCSALRTLHEPSLEALTQRYRRDPAAPEVDREVAARFESSLGGLLGERLEAACRAIVERAEQPAALLAHVPNRRPVIRAWLAVAPDDPALLAEAEALWKREDATSPLLEIVSGLLQQGVSDSFRRLWSLPGLQRWEPMIETVLDATADRPPEECRDLLLSMEPTNEPVCAALAERLCDLPGPLALEQMIVLLWRYPEAIAPALARRTQRAHDDGQMPEVDRILEVARNVPALMDALVDLPAEVSLAARLRPDGERQQLRLIPKLAGHRDDAAEEELLALLKFGSLRVKLAAAAALGTAGGPRALGPLDAQAAGWLVPAELRGCARTAATAIRARLGAGGLSVAGAGRGALSEERD